MFYSLLQPKQILFLAGLLAVSISNAAVIYTTESQFVSALAAGSFKNEFSNPPFAVGDQGVSSISQSGGTPTFTYTLATPQIGPGGGQNLFVVTPIPAITSPSSGQAMSTTVDAHDLLVTFTSGNVTAAGAHIFLSDVAEGRLGGNLTVTFTFSGDSLPPQTVTSSASGFANFLGVSTDSGTISSMLISGAAANEYATFDNFYVGQVTPVPELSAKFAVGMLCAFGIGHFVLLRKRKQRTRSVS